MSNDTLYVVATPIGNLKDITLRALEILKSVDIIVCEDTRVTAKLLAHYNIKKSLLSYHQHSRADKTGMIIQKIQEGKKVALVTDAGTPGVSDPGNKLVAEAAKNDIRIIPIPGPSALTAIISVAGIDMQNFIFKGFPPHKKGRETFFKEVAGQKYPVIYYESPYRLAKNLELLSKLSPNKFAVIGREITKFYEEITRDRIENLAKSVSQNKAQIKGELVVIVYPHTRILIA